MLLESHTIPTRTICSFRGRLSVKRDNLRAAEARSIKTSNVTDVNASDDYGVDGHHALEINLNDRILVDKE